MQTPSDDVGDERTPLLSTPQGQKPNVSVLQARIVSCLVPVFAMSAAAARDTLISQYLVDRLSDDAGFTNATTKFSPCFKDMNDSRVKIVDGIQAKASELLTYYSYAQCFPSLLACLIFGSVSDYLGRRLLLLAPLLASVFKIVIIAVIIKLRLDLRFMYLAYGIDGLFGSWFCILLALMALTADISKNSRDRTFWIYFLSCIGAIVAGGTSVANGYIIDYLGFYNASLLLAGMSAASFFIPLIFLPETLENRPEVRTLNPLHHFRRIFGFYFFDGSVRKRATFIVCLLLFMFGVANELNISTIDSLYQLHRPFCWASTNIGNYMALRIGAGYFLGLVLIKPMQRCVRDEKIGMLGILFQAIAYVYEAFITQTWMFYLVPFIMVPSTPVTAIIRTMMSLLAGQEKQGALFASIAIVETICQLATTTAFNRVYAATVSFFPGMVYLVMASCSFLTFLLFIVYFRLRERAISPQTVIVVEEHVSRSIQ